MIEFTTVGFVSILLTFVGTLAIGAFKAYERITKPGSVETWDTAKFGTFVLVVAVIMLMGYFASGDVSFPADELISVGLTMTTPIFGLFGLAYTTIIAGRLVKNDVIVPIVKSVKKDAVPVASSGGFDIGYTVTPTYTFGKSPVPVTFKIYATQVQPDHPGVTNVDIDWGDGSSQNVPLVAGQATVGHIFSFIKNDKYTGHTFYPVFIFNGNDGSRNYFNIDGKGVEIWVESL